MIATRQSSVKAHSLIGREVIFDQYGYEPHFLRDKIGFVVEAFGDETCLVRFEVDGKQVVFSIPARELCPVKNGGEA